MIEVVDYQEALDIYLKDVHEHPVLFTEATPTTSAD